MALLESRWRSGQMLPKWWRVTGETWIGLSQRTTGTSATPLLAGCGREVDNTLLKQPHMPPVTWPTYKRELEHRSVNPALLLYLGRPAGTAATGVSVSQGINLPPSVMSWATERWQSQIKGRKQIQMGNIRQTKEKIGSLATAEAGAGGQLPFCWVCTLGGRGGGREYFFFGLSKLH